MNILSGLAIWVYTTVITLFIALTLGVKGLYDFYKNILED